MTKKRFLIIGGGGREASFALDLANDPSQHHVVYAVIPHENPLIIKCIKQTCGSYLVGNSSDPDTVVEFARTNLIDYAFVNADEPLANGVVDALLSAGIKSIGGTKAATRIEWDKIYAIKMMSKLCPEYTPFYRIVNKKSQIDAALSEFKSHNMNVVVKPQGLTGGKGVKVMPEHLLTYDDCASYAAQLLDDDDDDNLSDDIDHDTTNHDTTNHDTTNHDTTDHDTGNHNATDHNATHNNDHNTSHNNYNSNTDNERGVLFVEKLNGVEFTIMGLTDGKHLVMSPATYDYPYRFQGDNGPGTGGMGCFSDADLKLPFMSDKDLDDCRIIMQRILDDMHSHSLGFTGVINGGFFKTSNGIKFMEFNSRFGDPECLNILSVLNTRLSEILVRMWDGTLYSDVVSFAKKASVNKYLVAKEYPSPSPNALDFEVDDDAIEKLGVVAYYASCIRTGKNSYRTIKKSRVVAFSATSDTICDASDMINNAIDKHVKGDLEYRSDIGSATSLDNITH